MSQFILGLFAGVVVGLVMEWIIDWAGLFSKRTVTRHTPQNRASSTAVTSSVKSEDEPVIPTATTPLSSNPDTTEE